MRSRFFFFCFCLFSLFSLLFVSISAQGQEADHKERPSVTNSEEPLKAFQTSDRISGEDASRFVRFLLFGVVGAIVIAFIFMAYYFEPSESTKPPLNTQPLRIPGVSRHRKGSEEQKPNRYKLEDDL